ncbi:MAG TPA: response regulator, partial [Polyangiaceae bacterium]
MILIVDDSLTVRMDLAEALEEAGFPVRVGACLADARATLARESPSLVVLDVVLPDGDGIELLREIRANEKHHTTVLMLSTEAEVADRIRGLKTGADDYVGKPYDRGYVVARARELLRKAAPSRTGATVLVIDDSATFREELRHALENAGYGVLTASSGEQGLRIAAGSRPTAVLVDGVLPGIDGTAVIRKIRLDAALRGTPCVLLTGSEGAATELRALDAGADAFIRKEEDLDVILARLAAVLRASSVDRADTPSLLGPRRVLAVDDSATYLQELAHMLRAEGYDAVLAHSGEEAIELLSVQAVDCILLDLLMPGLGGKETCRRIKDSPVVREIPLIMLTAVEDRAAMIEGLAAGADDYIAKSSDFEVLKARVRAQLRRKQFEDEHRRIRDELIRSELLAAEERAARQVAETRAALASELERKNGELEAFSYSVSHDLRAPLRTIDGFSQMVLDDYGDRLDDNGRDYLSRVRAGAQRMEHLIDDLLALSRVSSGDLRREPVDLSAIARAVELELQRREAGRHIDLVVQPDMIAQADGGLMRVLLENLLGNAWKFTAHVEGARIEIGAEPAETGTVYFVRDNGAGFDMARAAKLFAPFQRLHTDSEFPGTGIGLATAYRIVDRHGGRVWAEGVVGRGATVFFTIPSA